MKIILTIICHLVLAIGSSALAQNAAFTYQGLVTANATNFIGTGLLQFAFVTSTNANTQAMASADVARGRLLPHYCFTGGLTRPANLSARSPQTPRQS
jgi:hypothetical protein